MHAPSVAATPAAERKTTDTSDSATGFDEKSLVAAAAFFCLAVFAAFVVRYLCFGGASAHNWLSAQADCCAALWTNIRRAPAARAALSPSDAHPLDSRSPFPRPPRHAALDPGLRGVRHVVLRDARVVRVRGVAPRVIVASGHERQPASELVAPVRGDMDPRVDSAEADGGARVHGHVELLYRATPAPGKGDSVCSICLEPLTGAPVVAGACLHWVHDSCMRAWLAKSVRQDCPVCRLSLVTRTCPADAPAAPSAPAAPVVPVATAASAGVGTES